MNKPSSPPKDARAMLQASGAEVVNRALSNPANFQPYKPATKEDDDSMSSAQPFPAELLPDSIKAIARECARVLSVPIAMPAACCLAVVSAALGSRLRVRSINGKTTSANIMVMIAADTGSGKSETYRECVAPFEACHRRAKDKWRDEVFPDAKAETRVLEKEIKKREGDIGKVGADREAIKNDIAQMELKLAISQAQMKEPFYCVSDITTPELIRLLCRMNGQVFTASPDAKNFIDMILGRYNDGSTDEEVYLKGFSMEPLDRHRVGDGSQETPVSCITGLWLTQPDKLERLLAQRALSEGGLLPRLLMMQFHCPPLRVSMNEQGVSEFTRKAYEQTITSLFEEFRMADEISIIDADTSARKALIDYHNSIADRRELDLRDVTGFAARWGEYAWRLALVVHAASKGRMAATTPLSVEAARAGIALANWFAEQQLQVLQSGRLTARNERHAKVFAMFRDGPEIIASDIYRAGITPRGNPKLAIALLDEMVSQGQLAMTTRTTGRRNHTQQVYHLAGFAGGVHGT